MTFTVGDTTFHLLFSRPTAFALGEGSRPGEKLFVKLKGELERGPTHPLSKEDRPFQNNTYLRVQLGGGWRSIPFKTSLAIYNVNIPKAVAQALQDANNGGCEDQVAVLKIALLHVRRAFVRTYMRLPV